MKNIRRRNRKYIEIFTKITKKPIKLKKNVVPLIGIEVFLTSAKRMTKQSSNSETNNIWKDKKN